MILDKENLFSNDQAIVASAASENYIDFGLRELSFGDPIEILCQVVEDFTKLTSLTIALQTDDEITFSGATTLVSTSMTKDELVAGAKIPIKYIPKGNLRYMRLYYTVVGTNPDAGKIVAGVVFGSQEGHHDIPVAVAGS